MPREPTPEVIEAMCQARYMVSGVQWDDAMTEGLARIERMLAERVYAAIRASLDQSHPA